MSVTQLSVPAEPRPSRLTRMLNTCPDIGGVYSLTFSDAIVLTNDFAKNTHGGIPQGGWLLASACTGGEGGRVLEDEEIVLLRVREVTPLPNERDLVSGRMAVVRDAHASEKDYNDVVDVHTRAEHQQSALACDVMGVFYTHTEDPDVVEFGAELDNVWSSARYRVFMPSARMLSWIASYPKSRDSLDLGVVRFSSTRRNAQRHGMDAATVSVNVEDFVARKTFVAGMTRAGKMAPLTTRIPVPVTERFPTGWATIGALSEGDAVYAADGTITTVIGLSDIETKPVHRVHLSDGQIVECGPDHLWKVSSAQSRVLASNRTSNRTKASARDAATAQGAAKAADLRRQAGTLPVASYASAADVANLTGIALARVYAAVKESGIDRHLSHSADEVKTVDGRPAGSYKEGTALYPAPELLTFLADSEEAVFKGSANADRLVPLEQVVSTEQMLAEMSTTYGGEGRLNWAIRTTAAVVGAEAALPLDPYVLGAWLGDGHSSNGALTAGTTEACTDLATGITDQQHLLAQVTATGMDAHLLDDARRFLIGVRGLVPLLREIGVYGAKHIPAAYLRASAEQRLAVLQGLMDTDGTVDARGRCELSLSDARLAADALELVRSLGIKASLTLSGAGYRDEDGHLVECKDRHRIHFTPTTSVFRLPRKARRLKASTSKTRDWLYVADITVGEPTPMRCISVAHPEALYLTDGFIPTHNSNSIKTIVTAVYRYAALGDRKVGQIIFDPQGEYAKVNKQDGTGLRLLGDDDQVRIYTAKPSKKDKQEHPLRLNFYDTDLFAVAWDMVSGSMEGAEANYVRTFRSADMERPDPNDFRALTHWSRGYMAFYGLLYRAGYKGAFVNGASLSFAMKDEAAEAFRKDNPNDALTGASGTYSITSPEQASVVVDWVNKMIGAWDKAAKGTKEEDAEEAERLDALIGKWTESDQFIAVADVFKYAKGRGLAGLRELREFHDPSGTGDVNEQVWDDMVNGRVVILDLSVGSDTVTKAMSERLVTALVTKASDRFREGLDPIPFQVVVEEAHNLFERGRDAKNDPWVRLSKEAAKYDIGLLYATQEVTSVDQRILSNTHNWLVAHLNSDTEIRELAKYYQFGTFGESIKRAEDKGYVRLKTLSSPFIVPVQIAKFDHDMINGARAAAGLKALRAPGGTKPDTTSDDGEF